ncbi:hypothetical protein COCOBI_02-8480 [Coccomyxa sp. Obi]|nr:hypothetical protein COCOBI_02-8480 [Coccomyxa sp. Obi]
MSANIQRSLMIMYRIPNRVSQCPPTAINLSFKLKLKLKLQKTSEVSNFSIAANSSFRLPPATFGQPELSPLTVSLAPGNTTLPVSTLPFASSTPPPTITPGAQTTGVPPTTVQPQTTTAGGTTAQPQTTVQASTETPATSTVPRTTNPPTTAPTPTLDPQCAALTPPTACNITTNTCPNPPNLFAYCGCPQLLGLIITDNAGLTDMSYYSCLQRIASLLVLGNITSLNSLAGLQSLTSVGSTIYVYELPSLTTFDSSAFPALESSGGLYVYLNPALTSISGFPALTTITANAPTIYSNKKLTDISGLKTLAEAYGCTTNTSTPILAVSIEVYPNGPASAACVLNSYAKVCDYIKIGKVAIAGC